MNAPAMQSLVLTSTGNAPVTISAAALSGSGFTISGATFPATLNPSQAITLSLLFKPAAIGAATGQLTIISNSSSSPNTVVGLSGTGTPATPAALSAVSCGKGSVTGAATRACSVYLSAEALSPLVVNLASDSAAVAVPSAVTVSAGASHTGFAAVVSPVSTPLVVTLTASAGGVSQHIALQLNASIPTLSFNTSSLAFGNVTVNAPAKQFVTLSSTGHRTGRHQHGVACWNGFHNLRSHFPNHLESGPGHCARGAVQSGRNWCSKRSIDHHQ
jgi:hypothetical protein